MNTRNLMQRITVAIIAIPAILFLAFYGGDYFCYFLLLLVAIGSYEYFTEGGRAVSALRIISIPVAIAMAALFMLGWAPLALFIFVCFFLLVGIFSSIGHRTVEELFADLTYLIWGCLYLAVLYPFVYYLRGDSEWMKLSPGGMWLFFLLASIWVCDTAAMFIGSRWGKHKLAPVVSPGKSWEGFIAGFGGALLIAIVFKLFWLSDINLMHLAAVGLLIALFGQLGDLVESLWKRSIGIKDSSGIIPGHGGVLDRFDSLLFAAPVVYLYLKCVLGAVWLQSCWI